MFAARLDILDAYSGRAQVRRHWGVAGIDVVRNILRRSLADSVVYCTRSDAAGLHAQLGELAGRLRADVGATSCLHLVRTACTTPQAPHGAPALNECNWHAEGLS
jgi:hypothetical protein